MIKKGLWEGIQSLSSWIWDKVSGWTSDLWGGICDFFGIHSPSTKMAWIGDMMMKGLAGGIDETADEVVDSAKSMTKDLDSVFENLGTDLSSVPTNFELKNVLDTTASVPQNSGLVLNLSITAETFMWLYQSNFGWAYDYANDRPYKWTDSHGSIIKTYYRDSNVGGYIDYFASVDAHLSWLKLCRECKATFMFDQGSHNAKVSSGFSGLKNYIDSKALIDLDYVIDNYNKVVNDYFTRYFGPAATKMKDVFDKLNSTVKSLAQTYGVGSIRDCLYSKWTKSLLSPITTALDNAYKALNDAYADKTCAEYLEYKRRIDIESITPRFINADQGLGITSSYYTTSKQGVYNDMVALGFDKFAEPATCTIAMLKTLWSVS